MTQEEKQLLLKDLCARLPYGVVINVGDKDLKLDRQHQGIGILYPEDCSEEFNKIHNQEFYITISGCYYGEEIKPYLRPMSSMTKEEREEFENLLEGIVDGIERWDKPDLCEEYDWLNAHHFDYHGLIEKNIALEAPKGMYNIK